MHGMANKDGEWYWCLAHHRVEQGKACPERVRMGPYSSAEEAARWREKADQRNERWEGEDARWERGAGS
jgi:hypothetical protein